MNLRSLFSYLPWIAMRFVMSRSRNGLSFMTWISILGVAVGVAALIIVISVMAGFSDDLKKNLLEHSPHLVIYNQKRPLGFGLVDLPIDKFQNVYKDATSITPFVSSEVVLQKGKLTSSAAILGVEPSSVERLPWPVSDGMLQGTLNLKTLKDKNARILPSMVLADKVARSLGVKIGDTIRVINPYFKSEDFLLGDAFIYYFRVVGIFVPLIGSGGEEQNRFAITDINYARKFVAEYDKSLDEEQYVTGVALKFQNPWVVENLRIKINEISSDLESIDWQQSNSSLLFALQLEKYAMGFVLMLIVLVAAFSICGTLIMSGFHRRSQVSILRAIGMDKGQIFRLFMSHGALIGFLGVVAGLGISLCICYILHLNSLGKPIVGLDLWQLPVKFLPFDYVVICCSSWALTIVSSVFPSLMVSKFTPTDGLRGI